MKISVGSHATRSGSDPLRLCLGRQTLPVAGILHRSQDADGSCLFHVRVVDGRNFVLRRHAEPGQWELVAAYGTPPRPHPKVSHPPIAPLAAALAVALLRRALRALRRAVKLRRDVPHDLPSGGAPA